MVLLREKLKKINLKEKKMHNNIYWDKAVEEGRKTCELLKNLLFDDLYAVAKF